MKHLGKVQAVLAFILTVGFFGCIYAVMREEVASSMRDALLILIGAQSTAFGSVVNYYFGSSSGSAQKTALMGKGDGSSQPTD